MSTCKYWSHHSFTLGAFTKTEVASSNAMGIAKVSFLVVLKWCFYEQKWHASNPFSPFFFNLLFSISVCMFMYRNFFSSWGLGFPPWFFPSVFFLQSFIRRTHRKQTAPKPHRDRPVFHPAVRQTKQRTLHKKSILDELWSETALSSKFVLSQPSQNSQARLICAVFHLCL